MPDLTDHLPQSQLTLFRLQESTGNVELFPAVWAAAESLTSPVATERLNGLKIIRQLDAFRFSPLVAYLIASLLSDPNLTVRTRAVEIIYLVFKPGEDGYPALEDVRRVVKNKLMQMRQRQIFALLEIAVEHPRKIDQICKLLSANPYAGNHLSAIMTERKMPMPVRVQAIRAIGRVGFLDSLAALEKLAVRLESRLEGQHAMPFAPPVSTDEVHLLPVVRETIRILKSP